MNNNIDEIINENETLIHPVSSYPKTYHVLLVHTKHNLHPELLSYDLLYTRHRSNIDSYTFYPQKNVYEILQIILGIFQIYIYIFENSYIIRQIQNFHA